MTTMLTRYFFSLTQTQLILTVVISALIATIVTVIGDSSTLILAGYFFAVGYITVDFFNIQEKYMPMLRTMPISPHTIVKMQFSYMLQVCGLYGGIFVSLFLLYTGIRTDINTTLVFTVLSLLIGGSLLFFNILFLLEYTSKSGSGLFLLIIVLIITLGGHRLVINFFKDLSAMTVYNTLLFIFAAIMIVVTIVNFRFIVRLYERRDHA